MKTYNIELPAEFRSGNGVSVEKATITRGRMEDILRAAIEADRKRRGEPSSLAEVWRINADEAEAYGQSDRADTLRECAAEVERLAAPQPADPTVKESLSVAEPVVWLVRDDMLGTWLFRWEKPEPGLWKYVKPLYTAPQPAEPVDKSKNLQGSVVDKAEEMQGQPAEPVNVPVDKAGAVGHIFSLVRRLKNGEPVEDQLRQAIRGLAAEPRLDAPAQVGHTRFGEGVPWSTVIGAAQRYHAAQNTPAKEQERLQRAAENIKALHQAEPEKVPSDDEIEALVRKTASDVFGIGDEAYDQDDREFYGRFARALLARYGNNPGDAHE